MQAWVQKCQSGGKSEGAGQRGRQPAKRTKSEKPETEKGGRKAVEELPLRECSGDAWAVVIT